MRAYIAELEGGSGGIKHDVVRRKLGLARREKKAANYYLEAGAS